jgi:hypothetical protein
MKANPSRGVCVRRLLILSVLVLAACQRPVAPGVDDVAGNWLKLEKSMPPVDLTLTRSGTDLRARLRLSGRESFGTATIDGTNLRIAFEDQTEPLVGEFASNVELTLKLGSPVTEQHLRKQQ